MRIATYNVEWFTRLFDDDGSILDNDGWSGRHDVTRAEQLAALGLVFTAIDADAIMIVEAPDGHAKRSTVKALKNFARYFQLRAGTALVGFVNDTQQEIALLYDPDQMSARHDPVGDPTDKNGAAGAPRFDGKFRSVSGRDQLPDIIGFSKPPLEVALTSRAGANLRLIGVHVKSKAPYGARGAAEIAKLSIENRRKQIAQCSWLRNRVDQHLENGEPLIVLGDLNDGPGLDRYEKLFGRSGVEIVLGLDGPHPLFDPHAHQLLNPQDGKAPTSSRFYLAHQKQYLSALLDYVMVSGDIRARAPKWRIWHPLDDPICRDTAELRAALLTASDHFPVIIDLDI